MAVLILYTGGTIGSMPMDPDDPESPRRAVPWGEFVRRTPQLAAVPFPLEAWSLEPPVDSCDIGPAEWRAIAEVIYERYDEFEGFVILHGTDTMAYTASALSFMLVNLARPVVITGAQRSHLDALRNDGLQNLLTALQVAAPSRFGLPLVPEVTIFFRDKLLRGNRARKVDASGYTTYDSPNCLPLGTAGDRVRIDERLIRPVPSQRLRLRRKLDPHVIVFDVFPGMQHGPLLSQLLSTPGLRGAVVRAFGAGNLPTRPQGWLAPFAEAAERGVVLANVTQCLRGAVELGLYETSAQLLDVGMVSGTDITPEAALTKLMVLLGDEDLPDSEVPAAFQQSLAGEQTWSIHTAALEGARWLDEARARVRLVTRGPLAGSWRSGQVRAAVLRFHGAQLTGTAAEAVRISIHAEVASDEPLDRAGPGFAGEFPRRERLVRTVFSFSITEAVRALMEPGRRSSVTLAWGGGAGCFRWERAELAVFVKEPH